MKIIFKFFLIPVYFFVFIIDFFFYKIFKKRNTKASHKVLIYIFCFFGTKALRIVDFFLKNKKSQSNLLKSNNYINEINLDIHQANLCLNKNGYYLIRKGLTENKINNIVQKLSKLNGKYFSDNYCSSECESLNLNNPKATTFRYSSESLLGIEEVNAIILDGNLLSIVSEYLKCKPNLDIVTCWWSFKSRVADENSAQKWHFDLDRTKWLKIFIFLKDCTLANGAHSYIKGSHIHGAIPFKLRSKLYTRLEDSDVESYFDNNSIINMTAKKGDILLEDTLGLHKGNIVTDDNRLILQIQFSSNSFGAHINKIELNSKYKNNLFY